MLEECCWCCRWNT